MLSWQENYAQELFSGDSEQDLFDRVLAAADRLGFDHCAYGIRIPTPVSNPRIALFNNYPKHWQTRYAERGYIKVDPTVRHAMQSSLPLVWSDEVFVSARDLWQEAQSCGLRFGWAQASYDLGGSVGLLTLARGSEPLSENELREKHAKMSWLAHVVHVGMSARLRAKLVPEYRAKLSPREADALRWTAEGKTASEIAMILTISERTVHFHIQNAVAKLGATNKTQAAIRAAMLGLLL